MASNCRRFSNSALGMVVLIGMLASSLEPPKVMTDSHPIMKVKDLKENGIIITDVDSPSSIFVKNLGQKSIVGICLIWEFTDHRGITRTYTHRAIHSPSVMDKFGKENSTNKPSGRRLPIKPNETQLFSLTSESQAELSIGGMAQGHPKEVPINGASNASLNTITNTTQITVSIDCVILEDGVSIGPNTKGFLEQVQAKQDAKRELYMEILRRSASKRAADGISTYLKDIVSEPRGTLGGRDSNQVTQYQFYKYIYASELLRLLENKGMVICLDHIKSKMAKQWATLRKQYTTK